MPKVYNRYKQSPASAVYIGRKDALNHFGNPFSHHKGVLASVLVETREEAVQAFEDWIFGRAHADVEPSRRQWILTNLHTLEGKDLVCFCAPKPCHGDVLLRMANPE